MLVAEYLVSDLAQEGIVVGKGLPSHMRLSDPPQADADMLESFSAFNG